MIVEEINWLGSLLLNLKGVANLFGCHVAPFGTFSTSNASEELLRDDLSNDEMAIRMSKHFGYRITANNVANLLSRMRQPSDGAHWVFCKQVKP